MKKKFSVCIVLSGIILSTITGCASYVSVPDVTYADRSSGVVHVGAQVQSQTEPDTRRFDLYTATKIAEQTCRAWGYEGARNLNRQIYVNTRTTPMYWYEGTMHVVYQCTVNKDD